MLLQKNMIKMYLVNILGILYLLQFDILTLVRSNSSQIHIYQFLPDFSLGHFNVLKFIFMYFESFGDRLFQGIDIFFDVNYTLLEVFLIIILILFQYFFRFCSRYGLKLLVMRFEYETKIFD